MTSLLLGEVCADACFFSEQNEGNTDFLVYAKYQKSCSGERQKRGCSACSGGGEAAEGLGLGGRVSPPLPSSLSVSLFVSVSMSVSASASVTLSVSLFLRLCLSLYLCLFLSLCVSPSPCLSVSLCLCPRSQYFSLCVCLSLSVLSLSRSVSLFLCLFVSPCWKWLVGPGA